MFFIIVNIFLLLIIMLIAHHHHHAPPAHLDFAAVPSPGRAAAALRPLVALLAEAQGDDKNENEP